MRNDQTPDLLFDSRTILEIASNRCARLLRMIELHAPLCILLNEIQLLGKSAVDAHERGPDAPFVRPDTYENN